MRFIVCCIICLGAVYFAILRHDGYLVDPGRLAEALPRQPGRSLASAASARVEAACRQDPAGCLADAVALARPLAGTAVAGQAVSRRRGVLGAATP